jgi:hypothetical protein
MPGYVRNMRVWMFVWVYELTSASLGTSCSTMYMFVHVCTCECLHAFHVFYSFYAWGDYFPPQIGWP